MVIYFSPKGEDIMQNELVKFIRSKRRGGGLRGVLVGNKEGIGWSYAHPRDTFNKELGKRIARDRIFSGTKSQMPTAVEEELPEFSDRVVRYFK